ncbi:VWA containing CoxE family protein [Pyrolobus fumarii 1A]|uniref:VWA containing CoxE family protein n=1 Tax=Pyrolobus fumarii (strain DSM 11204 / 1A) TaxID=694429 RepID=G0ECD8_PYRF1|nr:VWA domain-containing protein [Pyrolobus fumarii]AEM39508.1 VWA containing CoxE family protein [Pyrolobus fumarii 1A]
MKEDLVSLCIRIAYRLRREGLQVGTSEIVDALRIAENLALLEGKELDKEILHDVIRAVFAHNDREETVVERVWREINQSQNSIARVIAAVEDDLRRLGLGWGSRIYSKKKLLNGPHAEERREAYSRLRLLGLIVRTPRGDVVLDRDAAIRRIRSLLRQYGSAWDALAASAARMISRGKLEWFALYAAPVDEEKLDGIEIDRIALAALQALQEGNRGLARKLASIVAKRLESGETPRDSWSAYKLLRNLDALTPRSLASLLRSEPRLALELLRSRESRDMLAEALRLLDANALRSILRKISHDRRGIGVAAGLLGEVDLSVWSEVRISRQPRSWEEAVVAIAGMLARAEQGFLAAARGDEAQLDYALYELEKVKQIDYSEAPDWAIRAIERYRERVEQLRSVIEGVSDAMIRLYSIVKRMQPDEALLYLREVYRSGDDHLKRTALRLAEIVWRRMEARAAKHAKRSSETIISQRGRVDVRRTVYNLVALRENPIVARKRRKKPSIALVLDTSGSMAKYTLWALLAASSFSGLVYTLTLFSSDVEIVQNAWKLSRRRIIELLFRVSFEGYTNISVALRETARVYTTPSKMVIVTDLCQTVEDERPSETAARLAREGWHLLFILPPRHCSNERRAVSEYATVRVVARPEDIPRFLSRLSGI